MRFTEEQARALEARGTNLLLSAAAGSGKTAVLIERVLQLLSEGADVDRILVVTFTRAAAAEMRMRLTDGLSRLAAEGDERFREQMLKLDRAAISTLHGFCAEFLRANFEAAGIDPAFRILDDAEDRHLLDEAVTDALEEVYARGGRSLGALDTGRGPARVRELAEALYAFLNERPDPEEWLKWAGDPARAPVDDWKGELSREARRAIDAAMLNTRLALLHAGCPGHYALALGTDLGALEALRALGTAEELQAALTSFKQARPVGRLKDTDPAAVKEVQTLRTAAATVLKRAKLSTIPLRQAVEDALKLYDAYPALIEIARSIAEKHARGKEERLGLSYSDLERLALKALNDPNTAAGVREQYDYVFVDEYQDISDVQEALIGRVSREDNLFVVGDVKQSIYRFRLAEPRLFLDRFQRYRRHEGGELLPLTRNFRSAHPVIDLVNAVFSRAMLGGDAEIVYDELARLNPGLPAKENAPVPEIHILDEGERREELDEDVEELGRAGREALLIANRVRQLMDEDKALRFRDIAILTRAKASVFNAMVPALLAEGIPAYAEGLSGYFDAMEIAFVVSVLKLIDNFRSDTELIGALRSSMAGLSLEELSRIRLSSPEAAFCDAARGYAESGDGETAVKLGAFFRMYYNWRLRAGSLALGELVRAVIDESGFYAYAGALPGGAQRQANLDRLVTRAERFDLEVSGSLSRFLAHAEHMRARGDGDSAQLLGENDDVVRLLTIHKSKGLEFPVVFGALTARRFRGARSDEML
ncbi:MAG: UvrD-helicase domain-containing protein, partial [Clostridiales bacterium]|nr:UvrD-helicase domain-containing protein [Clostridiales bacterium]